MIRLMRSGFGRARLLPSRGAERLGRSLALPGPDTPSRIVYESGPASFSPLPGILPAEPRPSDFIDQGPSGNPNPGAAPVPPAVLRELTNPVVPKIEPPFEPANLPGAALARQAPPAAPPWQGWEWVAAAAAGIFVLGLLARLLRAYVERKDTSR